MDVDLFMAVQEAAHPTFYQCLSDADTDKESGRKRAGKAVDRTLSFLDRIIERRCNNLSGGKVERYSV